MTLLKTLALTALISIPVAGVATAQDAAKPTAEQCDAWFVKLDTNKDGTVSGEETKTLTVSSAQAGAQSGGNQDAMIWTKDQFAAECAKGTYGMPAG